MSWGMQGKKRVLSIVLFKFLYCFLRPRSIGKGTIVSHFQQPAKCTYEPERGRCRAAFRKWLVQTFHLKDSKKLLNKEDIYICKMKIYKL